MPRLWFSFLLALWTPWAALATADVQRLVSPAPATAVTPNVSTGADGTVWLSWMEPLPGEQHRLMTAALQPESLRWLDPLEVSRGARWLVNRSDTPQVVAGAGGQLAAWWYVQNPPAAHDHHHASYAAWVSFSRDSGTTWSAPQRLSGESQYNEFVSITPVRAGRWLAVWLDGRAKADGGATRLYGRVLGEPAADEVLDERVCDCCATTMAGLPDGSVYVVYRDRSEDEVRDLAAVRWHEGRWTPARGLPADGWKIDGCPVNGPALSRVGARLGLVWFTAAEAFPRVQAALSNDFAVHWPVVRTLSRDAAPPAGRVAAASLRDGSLWSSWVSTNGEVTLARLGAEGQAGEPQTVPMTEAAVRAVGQPRLALIGSPSGTAQRLLLVSALAGADGQPAGLATHAVVALPAAATAATAAEDCGCDKRAPQEGHPVRGRVVQLLPEQESVLLAHEEVPGVMRAMTMAFRVDPRLLQFLRPEQTVAGQMARREDGRWWLFNVRIESRPPAPGGAKGARSQP